MNLPAVRPELAAAMTERSDLADDLAAIDALGSGGRPGEHARRFADWYGWRESRAPACPRVAAGRRCRIGHPDAEPCICQRRMMPLLDHARMWLTSAGQHIFTAEPYGCDGAELAELTAECAALGLSVRVSALSPWYPGRTVLLIIRRAEHDVSDVP